MRLFNLKFRHLEDVSAAQAQLFSPHAYENTV